jgi:hypothetical protein
VVNNGQNLVNVVCESPLATELPEKLFGFASLTQARIPRSLCSALVDMANVG